MKNKTVLLTLALAVPIGFASRADAVAPEKGQLAFGGNLGIAAPFESDYKAGFDLSAALDYTIATRLSLRATAGYAQSSSDLAGDDKHKVGYFLGSGVYNWELGSFHPFAVAGLGIYAVSPPLGSSTARFGVHAGGGVEYFMRRRISLTGQALFHFMQNVADRKASFVSVTAGARYYF